MGSAVRIRHATAAAALLCLLSANGFAAAPCVSRLYFTARHLDLDGTDAQSWKLKVADTVSVAVP